MKRQYKRITPRTVAEHAAQVILSGNNTQAVRDTEGERETDGATYARANRIAQKSKDETASQYIENSFEQISGDAIQAISDAVILGDTRTRLKAATYVVDQIRGKAVQRNISVTAKLNIQSVLD